MQEQDYILFEDYLSGALDAVEIVAFENRLQNDLEFNKAYKTYVHASKFLETHLENEEKQKAFKANLESVSSKYFAKEESSKIRFKGINPWYYSLAAAAILVIGFFFAQQFSNPVYGDYANYGTISLTVRGQQSEVLSKAETAFNSRNYKEAETYFSQALKTDTNNMELQLYRAVSLVELNNYNEADALFDDIIQTPSVYKNKAIWYLALSKLKQGDDAASINVLKTLPKDSEDFKEAQKLINKLK
ncbi:tetratricopeptide repeat protein [Xanthomarina sp. F2636L]|uniref:tetratricopeptide repeat protein n=1 Tax=Xanthomarina sp. F2636L TaxID=2996018 RepID=UPI00225E1E19|nr:tetratricopeptide repeat protein [Xanthomarina sp. F2636L]MCX7551600.1 tetratricopeptide repeat protein [Xanthomarina sp. F2636L]